MKNLVLSLAKVFVAFSFYVIATVMVLLVIMGWISFIQHGAFILDEHSISRLSNIIADAQAEAILSWTNEATYRGVLMFLLLNILAGLFVYPFYLANKIVKALKLDNWFVEANTKRLRTLGYFFAAVWVAKYTGGFILSILTNHFTIGISIPGSPFWFAVTSFLLSYMNQQGVQQHQEVELTV